MASVQPRGLGGELLLRRLRAMTSLSASEIELVLGLDTRARNHAPGSRICPKPDGSPHPRLIVSGWAGRPRILSDGRCQMISLLLPGDLLGDRGEQRPLAMMSSVALTKVTTVSAEPLFEATRTQPHDYPNLTAALGILDRLEESHLLDHVVRLARQTALQRVAHCLLDLYQRTSLIGLAHNRTFHMPLTQETLGDTLGLSLVHVNRIITQLKRQGLLRIRSGVATVDDFAHLAELADFSPPDYSAVQKLVGHGSANRFGRLHY